MMKSFLLVLVAYVFLAIVPENNGKEMKTEKVHPDAEDAHPKLAHNIADQKETKMLQNEAKETGNDVIDEEEEQEEYGESDKRAMGMLRLGKRRPFGARRVNALSAQQERPNRPMISPNFGEDKRAMGMLRLGRGRDNAYDQEFKDEEEKRAMGMLRLGRSYDDGEVDEPESKRAMGMLRLGRSRSNDDGNLDSKRAMGMLRLG